MNDFAQPASTPAFELHFEQRPGYLYAHVTGPQDSFAAKLAYWTDIAAECRRLRSRCVLVLDDLHGMPPGIDEIARLIQEMAGKGLEAVRIAYIEQDDEKVSLMEMSEVIAREQGFVARVFSDEEDAVRWLRYGSADGG